MQISHLPIGGALLATLALIYFIVNRQTGFGSIGTFLFSTASYGVGWICTFIVLLMLLKRGGFDWFPGGAALRYLVVSVLHVAAGIICLMVIIEISDSRGDWWTWPCFALATLVPVLIQMAALTVPGLQRVLLMTAIGLQCTAAVSLPVAVANRTAARKEEAFRRESDLISYLWRNSTIAEYAYFIDGSRQPGIPELAARTMAGRADHTEVIVTALHGPERLDALRLLSVKGIPPTPALAAAIADAIVAATKENATDFEALVLGDVIERYGAHSAQLIPVLEKFVAAAGDSSGRRHIQDWLTRVKGTR